MQKELGAYVDDELPDYIMVLVANKKTQQQMKDDLSLFLHNHADVFTDWLQDILNKLKQVATTGGKKKSGIKKIKRLQDNPFTVGFLKLSKKNSIFKIV